MAMDGGEDPVAALICALCEYTHAYMRNTSGAKDGLNDDFGETEVTRVLYGSKLPATDCHAMFPRPAPITPNQSMRTCKALHPPNTGISEKTPTVTRIGTHTVWYALPMKSTSWAVWVMATRDL